MTDLCHFQNNVSATFFLELLSKIAAVLSVRNGAKNELQEYIGSLTEGGIRKNATLVYELMHEIMVWMGSRTKGQDSGYVESTSAEFLHDYIYTKAENNQMQFVVGEMGVYERQNKLQMMAGQEMDMKSMVGAITNKSDLYITVKENIQCVMNANVGTENVCE